MIYIVVFNLFTQGLNEAIKKEAYSLYSILKNRVETSDIVSFVSIESIVETTKIDNIYYVNFRDSSKFFSNNPPTLIHMFVPFIFNIFIMPELLNYQMIITFSGGNPLINLTEAQLEELSHLIDVGNLYPVVQCTYSDKLFSRNLFRPPNKIYPLPLFDINDENLKSLEVESNSKVKIGFASSPYDINSFEKRGVHIIKDLARIYKDEIDFVILWRNENLNFYLENEEPIDNIKLFTGLYDMRTFYSQIDLVILPYTNKDETHALPFSLLESFIKQVPVLSSDNIASINELKSSRCVQIIDFENKKHLFLKYAKNVLKNKLYYINNAMLFLKKYCDIDKYQKNYFNLYNMCSNQIPSLSLNTWYQLTLANGTPLVKGIRTMKKYYEDKKVTLEYSKQRFSKYPFNIINHEEQVAVKDIITSNFLNDTKIKLIDLSSGDGRMLNVLNKIGLTIALDNSEEMHNISAQLNKNINKDIIRIIGDNFNIPIKNNSLDVIICFRFLRHFEYNLRNQLYKTFSHLLKNNGILIFDVPMKNTENHIRYCNGWGGYNIYDVCYTNNTLKQEMKHNHFNIYKSIPIGKKIFKESHGELSKVIGVKKKVI